MSLEERKLIIKNSDNTLDTQTKCELLGVARSSIYYQSKVVENDDAIIMNEIREIYHQWEFYGYRRIHIELMKVGIFINHKRVQRLMKLAGIKAIYPGKNTSVRNLAHKIYPYLLRGLKIERPNQVWQVDITYIKIRHGFVYLTCIIDVFSRKIMGWALSTFLDTQPCLEALTSALMHAKPEIVNSDQGCQFTSDMWIEVLTTNNIAISMDGKGRWADNVYVERLWRSVKYEDVYLRGFDTVGQARSSLQAYIDFYNQKRPHQSLNYHTPSAVYNLREIPPKSELIANLKSLFAAKPREDMIPKTS